MEQRFDPKALNQRPRTRVAVVLSMLAAVGATVAWAIGVVTLYADFEEEALRFLWVPHVAAVVVGAPLLWRWWHGLLQPPVYPERPDELDEAPRDHIGLHSDDPPPTRW